MDQDPRGLTTDIGDSGWPSAPADGPGAASGSASSGGEDTERALLAAIEAVRATIADEVGGLDTELGEIEMLASQATSEADRHEERRARAEERVTALERDPGADPKDLREARSQLLTQIRRAALFEAQQQLLEGKQRTLQRFRDRMARADQDLRSVRASAVRGGGSGGSGYAAALTVRPGGGDTTDPSVLLRAQEELRREIARQMHDGPAQSLANIALQAEIVLRLASRGDPRTQGELDQLRVMVEHALAATKEFIFDVRPMVLDDLGLVPTLRRTALDRGARAGVEIDLDSVGTERRLPQDTESGVFRLIDDTINGYLSMRPSRVAVRLEWGERRLGVMVRAAWLAESRAAPATPSANRLPDDLPPALRQMIEQTRDQERQTVEGVHALPPDLLMDLGDRARVMGVGLQVSNDGTTVELSVHTS
jgi:two-component system sensor histidine kinase DegS